MRLIYAQEGGGATPYNTVMFANDKLPCYAIFSHTWGVPSAELTYGSFAGGRRPDPYTYQGYRKLEFCGERSKVDGLKYFWIDTCCINRSDSIELLEALNSMYRWYKGSTRCYVYLEDVSFHNSDGWRFSFRQSRWFTRGWTLQELIAPAHVEFYSKEGTYLGDKTSLEGLLHDITKIPIAVLRGAPPSQFSIDERMSWGASRQTSRPEDNAYCMVGICEVFLPFMYGVGGPLAIAELQEKIRQSKLGARPRTQSHLRIGGASWTDLLALNDEKLKQLDSRLDDYFHNILKGELTDSSFYKDSLRTLASLLRTTLRELGVAYKDNVALEERVAKEVDLGAYRELALRTNKVIDKKTWDYHIPGSIAVETLIGLLTWRGKIKESLTT